MIQVLVATSTLAWGVNLPAHLVVIKGTEYYDAKTKRYVQLPVTDILQMIGRAGRPQFDDEAIAVVLVHQPKKNFYKKFLYHSFPVESCLHESIHDHINAEIAVKTLKSVPECVDYLTRTFLFRRLIKNPTYYQLENAEAGTINKYLKDLVRTTLWNLHDSKCIEFLDDKQNLFEPSFSGEIASYYYLHHTTMGLFHNSLLAENTYNDLLRVLCATKEYEELPVRHNEEKLNLLLAEQVPWPVDDLAMDEPSTKANLLFQAHFSRLQLPISDYVTDTQSVLDQAIRIIQAMIDFVVHHGWLNCVVKLIHLLQMVTQGRWLDDSTLLNVPGLTEEMILKFWDMHIESLPELMSLPPDEIRSVMLSCNGSDGAVSNQVVNETINTLKTRYPRIAMQLTASKFQAGLDEEFTLLVKARRFSGDPLRVYSPRWFKPKMEGWFIVVTLHGSNELLALKRIRISEQWKTTKITVKTPSSTSQIGKDSSNQNLSVCYDVYLMSDGYLGLDLINSLTLSIDPFSANLNNANVEADPISQIETVEDLLDIKNKFMSSSWREGLGAPPPSVSARDAPDDNQSLTSDMTFVDTTVTTRVNDQDDAITLAEQNEWD
ncbi:hypothetical protein RFI_28865 [Reticulomyxa filosa]|uniref:SEC63 domain-containing protein n=1 Tax=Reticulomyxa filosa TaxID=46433 RepID=X6M3H6_RETFI|nr:hypothetical protein RFI_28865 [Reticulomyxa filosa]|eukprot:ETO08523.1 hypothetical protein RFI_28865 [Reticulomyxa filosa]